MWGFGMQVGVKSFYSTKVNKMTKMPNIITQFVVSGFFTLCQKI